MSTAAALVTRPAEGRDLRSVLAGLLRLDHLIGGLVVAPDGLLIAANLPHEIDAESLSAVAAALGRELELQGPRLRRGTFPTAQFASVSGSAFLGSTPVGYIVLLGEPRADWERVRSELRAALGRVYRAWAG
jgi:predicted regulator of Ras-like GTPase activity (Roadblock/LC7/MglB family)